MCGRRAGRRRRRARGAGGSARRVRRGVLLRPLGDVVVAHAAADHHRRRDRAHRRGAGRGGRRGRASRDVGGAGLGRAELAPDPGRGPQWRDCRTFDPGGPWRRGCRPRAGRGRRSCRSPPTTTSGLSRAPRRGGRGPRRRSTAGAPAPARPAWWPAPARPRRARGRAGGLEGEPRRPCCSPPGTPPTSASWPRSAAAGVTIFSDELQPRLDRRRLPPGPGRGRRLPPRRPGPRRRAADGAARPRRGRDRHRLLHGRRRGAGRRPGPTPAPRHGALLVLDEAHAVLGPERAPGRRASTCCGSAPCRSPSARSAVSWPAPRRVVDLLVNRARPFIFTTAPSPADAAAGAGRALGVLRSPEGAALLRRLRRQRRRRSGPGTPPRSSRSCSGREPRPSARRRPCSRRGLLVPAIRPADRPAGDVPAAHHPVGRPHRRAPGPPPRRAGRPRT